MAEATPNPSLKRRMASRKITLVALVLAISVIGSVLASTPFVMSLNPNDKALGNLPRFPVPELGPNSYTYIQHSLATNQHYGARILVVSQWSSKRGYWYIPTRDGTTTIPDYFPWRAGIKCKDLSPDFQSETILCKDEMASTNIQDRDVWNFDGRDLGNYFWLPDLDRVNGKEVNGDFILLHPDDA